MNNFLLMIPEHSMPCASKYLSLLLNYCSIVRVDGSVSVVQRADAQAIVHEVAGSSPPLRKISGMESKSESRGITPMRPTRRGKRGGRQNARAALPADQNQPAAPFKRKCAPVTIVPTTCPVPAVQQPESDRDVLHCDPIERDFSCSSSSQKDVSVPAKPSSANEITGESPSVHIIDKITAFAPDRALFLGKACVQPKSLPSAAAHSQYSSLMGCPGPCYNCSGAHHMHNCPNQCRRCPGSPDHCPRRCPRASWRQDWTRPSTLHAEVNAIPPVVPTTPPEVLLRTSKVAESVKNAPVSTQSGLELKCPVAEFKRSDNSERQSPDLVPVLQSLFSGSNVSESVSKMTAVPASVLSVPSPFPTFLRPRDTVIKTVVDIPVYSVSGSNSQEGCYNDLVEFVKSHPYVMEQGYPKSFDNNLSEQHALWYELSGMEEDDPSALYHMCKLFFDKWRTKDYILRRDLSVLCNSYPEISTGRYQNSMRWTAGRYWNLGDLLDLIEYSASPTDEVYTKARQFYKSIFFDEKYGVIEALLCE